MSSASDKEFWSTSRGRGIAIALALAISAVLLLGNLGGIGIWEPWESNEIAVAQEYATRGAPPEVEDPKAASWNWAVPTHNQRPVDRPLLKTLAISASVANRQVDAAAIGSLERSARLPIALATLLLAAVMLAWLARRFGTLGAAVSTVALVSSPAVYLGAHNLASEMLFVVTSSLAIMAFAELMLDARRRWLWGALFGVSLAACVLDQRLFGLYLPLFVLACFAVCEVVLGEAIRQRDGPSAPRRFGAVEVAGALGCVAVAAAVVAWMVGKAGDGEDADTPAWALQIGTVVIPPILMAGMFWFARKSRPGRALFSAPGIGGLAVGVVAAIALARAYSAANPVLLDGGALFGSVRVLGYMVSNHVFEAGLTDSHLTFDVAVRQVGFALFPWVALLPLGFVWVSRATATREPDGRERGPEIFGDELVLRRLFLVWIVASAVGIGLASGWSHYFYPAYVPIAASIGLCLTDRDFWSRMRGFPLAPYAVGFVGITIVLMLGKDLERFPARFVETYLTLQEGFEFPEDFSWGRLYKPLKYLTCAVLAAHFFGLASWAVITVRRARNLPAVARALRERRFAAVWGAPTTEVPFVARLREKEEIRRGAGIVGRVTRLVETPDGFAPLLAAYMAFLAAMFLFVFVPNVTHHLSQRGVFETYTTLANAGEPLLRYQVSSRDNSIYLTDVDAVQGAREFAELFDAEQRFFAVIPRAKLASINYDMRKQFQRNVYVLDARSSRLLLVSNQLADGETDESFVNDKIVVGEPDIDYPVTFKSNGADVHPVFDEQLEFLGYSLDKEPAADGIVEYGWGDTMVVTYFFRVLARVPSSQKIFLHVDYPGARINGDHVPNNGDFPTNYWLEGDIVKDVHPLKIDSYSTPGIYTMHMGFFLGSRRMKVTPREAHDGRDRITIGTIRVQGL